MKSHKYQSTRNKALKQWQLLNAAVDGDAEAQFSLGVCYFKGEGMPQNYVAAVAWFKLAAKQGLADAQYNFGVCSDNGYGVPQNYLEAINGMN